MASQRLLDELLDMPKSRLFSKKRIAQEEHLFANRAALFYTPSDRLPSNFIGSGSLDVTVPLAIPTFMEVLDNRFGHSPRLWVDLLQRATNAIRWTPMRPANVVITRYDVNKYGSHNLSAKALVDALKQKTHGRRDKVVLHYFGAIYDDNTNDMPQYSLKEELVTHPHQACTRIQVDAV
jgi:hypothetical protein